MMIWLPAAPHQAGTISFRLRSSTTGGHKSEAGADAGDIVALPAALLVYGF
jgi:hypothetical protein